MPNLEPRLIRPYRATQHDHLDDLVEYRVHQAILNYVNSPRSIESDLKKETINEEPDQILDTFVSALK